MLSSSLLASQLLSSRAAIGCLSAVRASVPEHSLMRLLGKSLRSVPASDPSSFTNMTFDSPPHRKTHVLGKLLQISLLMRKLTQEKIKSDVCKSGGWGMHMLKM